MEVLGDMETVYDFDNLIDEIEKDGLILGKDRLLTESSESSENYESIKLIEGDSSS